jgi:uncharacterized membrane protein YphA (DoxX/SURF4 family)
MRYREPRASGLAVIGLTCVRLALGIWWVTQYRWKPPPSFGCPDDGFCLWLAREAQFPFLEQYVQALRILVLPNPMIAAWVVFVVETAIGISLIFGLYTRLGAMIGVFWSIVLLVGMMAVPGVASWTYISVILLDVIFFSIGSMSQLAVDRILMTRSWWAGSG